MNLIVTFRRSAFLAVFAGCHRKNSFTGKNDQPEPPITKVKNTAKTKKLKTGGGYQVTFSLGLKF